MPKTRNKPVVRGQQGTSQRVRFKIGGRKSTRCALTMSDAELVEMFLAKSTRGRDRNKLKQVIQTRGLEA